MNYFTDPIFRAPMIGSMLICLATSLIGVVTLMKKRSLLGEALSHATYPGVMLGALLASIFATDSELISILSILVGAFISAIVGLKCIEWMVRKARVKNDTALCFTLAVFFGIGLVVASRMQITHSIIYQNVQSYLYGQAATLTDLHVGIYAGLVLAILAFIYMFYYPIQIYLFDPGYAKMLRIKTRFIENMVFTLLVLSIVIGIRSVGIVLISGMLIAPAVAARQFTNRLSSLFVLSGLFGVSSAFLGNLFSLKLSSFVEHHYFPTGPTIVLVGISWTVLSLLLAPKKGLLFRYGRIFYFKRRCIQENILKSLWKVPSKTLSFSELRASHSISKVSLLHFLKRMRWHGWLSNQNKDWSLTLDGQQKASQIVRLHRLWELYLVENLGLKADLVHQSAEKMEHILTPEIERKLTQLLSNPTKDPHKQPIPGKGRVL